MKFLNFRIFKSGFFCSICFILLGIKEGYKATYGTITLSAYVKSKCF